MIQNTLLTILLGGLPLIEARYALVISSQILDLNIILAVTLAYIGNAAAIFALATILYKLFPKKENFVQRFLNKIIEIVRRKRADKINNLAFISLLMFIAVPLPVSGSYSGILIGYLAGLSYRQTLLASLIGTAISIAIILLTLESIDISSKFFVKFFN